MRLARFLDQGIQLDLTSATAQEVLYAGTMGGANAIERNDELGSIDVGKMVN